MGTGLVAVYGTHGGDWSLAVDPCADPAHWWHYAETTGGRDSAWWSYMRTVGFAPLRTDTGFDWSGDINGLDGWNPLRLFNKGRRVTDWQAGGRALSYYAGPAVDAHHTWACVAHSHGGQVALFAAFFGLTIPHLITIATPHRADLAPVTHEARKRIGHWIHVSDRYVDEIGLAGQLGDGVFDVQRTQPLADVNVVLSGIAHTRVLSDPAHFHHWIDSILPRQLTTKELQP